MGVWPRRGNTKHIYISGRKCTRKAAISIREGYGMIKLGLLLKKLFVTVQD